MSLMPRLEAVARQVKGQKLQKSAILQVEHNSNRTFIGVNLHQIDRLQGATFNVIVQKSISKDGPG